MENFGSAVEGAEAVLHLQPAQSITVSYHPSFGSHDDILLVELDEELLADVFHDKISLRGQPDEDAVLCNQSKTYAIKFVETSNCVLLVPPDAFCTNPVKGETAEKPARASVLKVACGTLELNEVAPRLDKLKFVLSKNKYTSEEMYEMGNLEGIKSGKSSPLYKWDDLVSTIQASDDELRAGLMAFEALDIDGNWRIVDEKCMGRVLNSLLCNSILNGWSLNDLVDDEITDSLVLDGFCRELCHHCLHVYAVRKGNGSETSHWSLNEKRVSAHFAREILGEGKKEMGRFMDEWLQKLPDGTCRSFDILEGEVLTEKLGVETWVHAFSVSSLPLEPAKRFSVLFKERSKWNWKDLQPYIRDLNVPGLSSDALLLKYTRRIQPNQNSEPVFTAR